MLIWRIQIGIVLVLHFNPWVEASDVIFLPERHWLIDWLFIVLRPAHEYFTDVETSPLPVKGCKI
jgi:hypothetical protein